MITTKTTTNTKKSNLWEVLVRYDGIEDFNKFCNSLSKFIQDEAKGEDILTVYTHSNLIDRADYKKIDEAIGAEISNHLFVI